MLKVNLVKLDKYLAFQVSEQTAPVTAYIDLLGKRFTASNGWKIKSIHAPEIDLKSKTIYLRGSETIGDNRVWLAENKDQATIDLAYNEIKLAIKEFTNSLNDHEYQKSLPLSSVYNQPITNNYCPDCYTYIYALHILES